MFCPGCGIKVESSYNFCPGCGFKLSDLIRNQNHGVSTSAHQPSIAAQEKNQKEEQDQVSTDVDEKQENTAQIKGQLASDDLEPDKDGATAQDPSDKTASQATLEKGAMPSSPKETLGVAEAVTTKKTQVIDALKEEERLAATAPESNAQPCREAAPGSNLVCLTTPSSTQAGDKPAEQQTEAPSDNSKDDSPHAEKPSNITLKLLSNSASNLKSTTETVSTAPETPQQCDSVAKQSIFEQDEDKTISHDIHNLSGSADDNHTNSEQLTFPIQTDRREDEAARDQSNSDDPNTKTTEFSADQHSVTKETAQSTEADEPKSDKKINTETQKQQQGEWHQYDDMIHPEMKKTFWPGSLSPKDIVMKGRDLAGREMLNIIFDLLTTWDEPNVNNFFLLLQQFFYTYSHPVLHHDSKRPWGLTYGIEQVEILLKGVLEEKINHNLRRQKQTTKSLSPLHTGVVSLLLYSKYLKDDMKNQLSNLCNLLCLPKMQQHKFSSIWKEFEIPFADKKRVADAVEILSNNARQHNIDNWVLVIPLIHLLRGESKPFEPAPPVVNPQLDSWTGLSGSKGTHFNGDNYDRSVIRIMKDHAYLTDIDRLLVHSWMPLLRVDDFTSFIKSVQVELLDILHYIQFSIKPGTSYMNYKALKDLLSHLNNESHLIKSFDNKYGECCLKTAVGLLGSVCHLTTDPENWEVPIYFLDLVWLIAKAYDHTDSQARAQIHEEFIMETLRTMREWRRNTFRNKLLNEWNRLQFSVPHEITVWKKLLSVSFSHEGHTSFWRTTFTEDFEGKLKREHPVDQIGIYTKKMEELSKTSPLLCITMEKCALDAVAAICQDKSGKAVSALIEKHDIRKFGKLMSVVVLKTWPTDANGEYIEGEDLIFEYLVNNPMAQTVFQMTGVGGRLIDQFSNEVQIRMTLASSAFKSVSQKFLSGEIQMKTLDQILQKKHEFVGLLKIG
ncbi:hypothetical protein NQZ68_004659 [Dissostichus eleginoides]|nr:hypothetical protein NQZ68_004659 [Dissostichus eleginoides]